MCKWILPIAGLHPVLVIGTGSAALPCFSGTASFCLACTTLLVAASTALGECPSAWPGGAGREPLRAPVRDTNRSWTSARHARSYSHLEGDVRLRWLYNANKFFLFIDKTGQVSGTRQKNRTASLMEIRSVSVGVVAIKSVNTGLYLAMSKEGILYGSEKYNHECKFKERIEENGFNTYAALCRRRGRRQMFVSLNGRGKPQRGHKAKRRQLSTHFLPMLPT